MKITNALLRYMKFMQRKFCNFRFDTCYHFGAFEGIYKALSENRRGPKRVNIFPTCFLFYSTTKKNFSTQQHETYNTFFSIKSTLFNEVLGKSVEIFIENCFLVTFYNPFLAPKRQCYRAARLYSFEVKHKQKSNKRCAIGRTKNKT